MQGTEVEVVAFPRVMNEVSINSDPSMLTTMTAESMMNPTATFRFFLLGATGRTGLPFLAQALAPGDVVTIFVRDVSKLPVGLEEIGVSGLGRALDTSPRSRLLAPLGSSMSFNIRFARHQAPFVVRA